MKKIGIHGSYYGRNFGDTLILHIIRNWIHEYNSSIEVSLPYINSDKEAIEILETQNIKRKINELDGLIFGPGGYFGERPGDFIQKLKWSLRNYRRHIFWNRLLYKNEVPYIIIGVGVGPISFNFLKKRIIKLFNNAQYVSVRDIYSKQYLIEWGLDEAKIHIAPDVALTLKSLNKESSRIKKRVAIHYPANNLIKEGKIMDFVEFIKTISINHDVCFLEDEENQYSENNSNSIYNFLLQEGLSLPIIKYVNPSELIKNINTMDKLITSKLHVGIVSYALGKNVLSIPNHTKIIRFYEQINSQAFCIPLSKLNSELLLNKFEKLNEIDNSKNILYEEALKNRKMVFEFLEQV
jgi:polysaccharide pyruvyl transferase WcaK-like protein